MTRDNTDSESGTGLNLDRDVDAGKPVGPREFDASPTRLRCYSCNNRYRYLGTDAHDGVCPDCGSRVVSTAGTVSVDAVRVFPIAESDTDADEEGDVESQVVEAREGVAAIWDGDEDATQMVELQASDETDRQLRYWAVVHWERESLLLLRVCLEELTITGTDPKWAVDLAPPSLATAVESDINLTLDLSAFVTEVDHAR